MELNNLLLIGLIIFALGINDTYSQKFIQLELPGDPIALKYFEGMSISYKISDYPDEFFNKVINRIDVNQKMLVFDDGYITMDQITHIRRYRPWVKALGYSLNTFGVVYLTYGGLAAAFADYDFRIDNLAIGGSAILVGWVLRKWLYKKDYKIGNHAGLRMLDISFPSPEEVYKKQ